MIEMIHRIRVALLTTIDPQGRFHTRPVQTLQVERGEMIWFFTDWGSPKVGELVHDHRVSLGYADPGKRTYLAVSGLASLLRDPTKAGELWTAEQRAYYPAGPGDRRLALLGVRIEQAEYWIAGGRVAHWMAGVKAVVTRRPAELIGENQRVR
jgi:general stress protein 26